MRAFSPLYFGAVVFCIAFRPIVTDATPFSEAAAARIEDKPNVKGDAPGWFFLTRELKHLGTNTFWEQPWEDVAANQSDPIPSIVEFKELLEAEGIDLLLVPVPAKAAIYPEKLIEGASLGDVEPSAPFFEQIREAGVSVLNLEPLLRELRDREPDQKLYCEQDAHFSPYTAERIAGWIADELKLPEPKGEVFEEGPPESLMITGDQVAGSEWESAVPKESVTVSPVLLDGVRGVVPDDASSVLVLGDSHTLVFHEGEDTGMHTTGAGVFDHLSLRLGAPAALVGVRGSGLVQARKQLFYRAAAVPRFWSSKETVVWLFSVREFTQSTDRLIPIPLQR